MAESPIKTQLLNLGLPEKETDVYLALLSLGKGTVSQIALKASINRTTGYDILADLVRKGLVSISGKEPKQEYVAENPDQLLHLLREDLAKNQIRIKEAATLIPQLKSLHNVMGRPQVRFYEGKEGLEQVYEDTLTTHEPIRGYANVDEMHKGLPNYFPKYYKRRTQKGIQVRAIIPSSKIGKDRAKEDKNEMRESALIPSDQYYFAPEINVYDNKVMIASWREKLGIIIESQEIADAMKKIYELAWAEAKRLEKDNSL